MGGKTLQGCFGTQGGSSGYGIRADNLQDEQAEDYDGNDANSEAAEVREDADIQLIIPLKPIPEFVDLTTGDEHMVTYTAKLQVVVKEEKKSPVKCKDNTIGQEHSGSASSVITICDSSTGYAQDRQPWASSSASVQLDIAAIRQLEVDCLNDLIKYLDGRSFDTMKRKFYRVPSLTTLTIVAMELPISETNLGKIPGMATFLVRNKYSTGMLRITQKYRQKKFAIYKAANRSRTLVTAEEAETTPPVPVKGNGKDAKKVKPKRRNEPKGGAELDSSDTDPDELEGINGHGSPPAKRTRRQASAMANANDGAEPIPNPA